MKESLFRKKNLERISSPEQLNDYIRVSTPAIWILLVAVIILLLGALVWATFGSLDVNLADGTTRTIHPIQFVTN